MSRLLAGGGLVGLAARSVPIRLVGAAGLGGVDRLGDRLVRGRALGVDGLGLGGGLRLQLRRRVVQQPGLDALLGAGEPEPGRVCTRPTPEKADVNFIKRIVAGPGDRLSIVDGHVVLNGKPQKEPFIRPCGGGEGCNLPTSITVPKDHYFMMGDNRGASDDSRFWGPVPREWIIGNAFATYWPPKKIGLL